MDKYEKAIYDEIVAAKGKITQLQLARKVFVGSHPVYENYEQPKSSTLRRVRQIIRDLRMKHGLFILSDMEGYWIMKERSEAIEYLNRIEKIAKATSKGYFDTYKAMQRNFGLRNDWFEQQGKLF